MHALQSLRGWGIQPYDLKSVGHGITEEFARRLISRGLLPEGEFNDGLILAETALAQIPALVTSDRHRLNIPSEDLQIEFDAADLSSVTIAHPRQHLEVLWRVALAQVPRRGLSYLSKNGISARLCRQGRGANRKELGQHKGNGRGS